MEFTMMERLQYFDMLHGMAHKEVRTKGRLLFDLLEFPFQDSKRGSGNPSLSITTLKAFALFMCCCYETIVSTQLNTSNMKVSWPGRYTHRKTTGTHKL